MLAVRYAWFAGDIVDGDLLRHGEDEQDFPRQIFWQKDECENGERRVRGAQTSYIPALCTGHSSYLYA